MPLDSAAAFADALRAIIQGLIELVVMLLELLIGVIFWIVSRIARLFGWRDPIPRPDWLGARARREGRAPVLAKVAVITVIAGIWAALEYGRTEIHFRQSGFSKPDQVQVTLATGDRRKVLSIQNGKLEVMRGRWERLEITDPRYVAESIPISGRKVFIWMKRAPGSGGEMAAAVVEKAKGFMDRKLQERRDKKEREEEAP